MNIVALNVSLKCLMNQLEYSLGSVSPFSKFENNVCSPKQPPRL